jgi:hypothetical protein
MFRASLIVYILQKVCTVSLECLHLAESVYSIRERLYILQKVCTVSLNVYILQNVCTVSLNVYILQKVCALSLNVYILQKLCTVSLNVYSYVAESVYSNTGRLHLLAKIVYSVP